MDKKALDLFWYWVNERQRIYLAKERGDPKPWTDDEILQSYKFTNVFREQDKETVRLRERIKKRDSQGLILWKILVFRMFNWHGTYDELNREGLINDWNVTGAKKVVDRRAWRGDKVFSGAYIITNAGSKRPKTHLICEALNKLHKHLMLTLSTIKRDNTIEDAVRTLTGFPMIGKFVAYELATDLRHTPILSGAEDIMTWANPGPGAMRGLNRIFGGKVTEKRRMTDYKWYRANYLYEMRELLDEVQLHIDPTVFYGKKRKIEMRDIEHSLCEFDKYMRVLNDEGRPRGRYDGKE